MMDCWVVQRPHLKGLADKVRALFTMADEAYQRGRRNGDAVDYAAFEERVSRATAELECAVHQTVLGSLDIDVPFVRVWGKSYRRVHRTERSYGTMAGAVPVTRTLYRELGKRSGPVLDPVAMRAGVVDASWLPRTASTYDGTSAFIPFAPTKNAPLNREVERGAALVGRVLVARF